MTRPGSSRARCSSGAGSRCSGRRSRAATGSWSRWSGRTASGRWRPTAASLRICAPRSSTPPGSKDPAGCTCPATRCSPSRSRKRPWPRPGWLGRAGRSSASTSRRGARSGRTAPHAFGSSWRSSPRTSCSRTSRNGSSSALLTRCAETAVLKRGSRGVVVHGPDGSRGALGGRRRRRRHDRRRRRARGGLPRRRHRARAGGSGALRRRSWERLLVIRTAPNRPEVQQALRSGGRVVALETTLVAHGFPPGEGVEVGLASERGPGRRSGACDGRRPRRRGRRRPDRGGARALRRVDARKVGPRDLAAAVVAGRARRHDRRRHARRLPRRPGSASWRPAGSAASTAAGRRRPTSRPTSHELARRRRSSSPPASSRCSTCPRPRSSLETLGVPVLGWRTDDAAALLRRAGGPAGLGASRERRARRPRSRARTGSSAAAGLLLGRPPTRASTTSSR